MSRDDVIEKEKFIKSMYDVTKVIASYRVTIPKEVREDLDIDIGDKIIWTKLSSDKVLIEKK